ncbi:MAG: 4-hydroxy-tetrahydrodipicolinate reductase [Candidatus Omnitrophica bacterium]|nr:4-hydroxy-tetrahydrodipicolinate reductase [Candidatus Omnitrophota bacterium]
MKNERIINVAVAGACGRMGSTIISLLQKTQDMKAVWIFESKNHPSIGAEVFPGLIVRDNFEKCPAADVLIDFTTPEATMENIEIATKKKIKAVIGTTGFSQEHIDKIKSVAKEIPVLVSPNMSIGVNIMMKLVELATTMLGKDYEVEIVETHHHNKKDAPSGTALRIGEIINNVRGKQAREGFIYGRSGTAGPRTPDEIGIHAIRISDVVGEHSVMFGGKGEILEISHRCFTREAFAQGALIAARFIVEKEKGFYQMADVIDWLKKQS